MEPRTRLPPASPSAPHNTALPLPAATAQVILRYLSSVATYSGTDGSNLASSSREMQTPGPAEPEMASLIVKVRYARNQASPARRQPLNQKHPVRNPPRPASADLWRREPRATGPLPAFMRRPRPIKASSMSCPDKQRGRSAATRVDGAHCSKEPRDADRTRRRRDHLPQRHGLRPPDARRQRSDR